MAAVMPVPTTRLRDRVDVVCAVVTREYKYRALDLKSGTVADTRRS